MSAIDRTMHGLLAPPRVLEDADRLAVRTLLVAGLSPLAEQLPVGAQAVVSLPALRRMGTGADPLLEEPFTWKPAYVRRSLGLAVVQACATGHFRAPAQAVAPVADAAVEEWSRTGWRTFHWEPWLAGLAPGARAVVLADALTWATALWSALDWGAMPGATQIGGLDDQWVCPATRTLRLRARSELRVPLSGSPGDAHPGGPSALVSVSSGCPGPGWSEELAYLALVAGLRSPSRPVPSRVLGLWPDAGFRGFVEIDRPVLEGTVERVVATAAGLVQARTTRPGPGGADVDAAAPPSSLAAA
jgi:hypothetical protein